MAAPHTITVMIAVIAGIVGGALSYLVLLLIERFPGARGPTKEGDGADRVRRLTLVDDAGRERAVLRLIDGDVTLLLTAEGMRWCLRLIAGSRGPFLHFAEGLVNTRVGIGILQDGSPGLEFADADGTPRASLSVGTDGTASLKLRDEKGRVRGSLEVPADGEPSLVFSDRNGATLAKLP